MKTIFDYMLRHRQDGHGASAASAHGFTSPRFVWAGTLKGRLRDWMALRRTQTELRSLSDAQLRDLGLSRDEVEDPSSWPRHRIGRRFD